MSDVRAFYAELGIELPEGNGSELPVSCFADPESHRHGDRNRSASVNAASGLWCCYACGKAGGPYDAALAAGRAPADAMQLLRRHRLVNDDDRRASRSVRDQTPLLEEDALKGMQRGLLEDERLLARVEELRGWTRPTLEHLEVGFDGKRLVFPLRDAAGSIVGVSRYLPPGAKRDAGAPKTIADAGSRREVFPPPETLDGDELWIVEGESDVASATELGILAVGIGGVENWSKLTPERVADRRVVVCFDADAAGRRAAEALANEIADAAAEVRVLDLNPGSEDGEDITDRLLQAQANGGIEAARELLAEAAARVTPTDPKAVLKPDARNRKSTTARCEPSTLIDFTAIKARRVKWAWPERIALGKITALSGKPKVGKGLLYSDLTAKATRGTLGGDLDGPAHVIVVTTEDDPGDTLKPRLLAAGADLSRVSYFRMGTKDDPVPFRVPEHAEELGRRIEERSTALVVIDPLIEFIDGSLDAHKSQAVRRAFASLNPLAREHRCAILALIHLNKGASTDTHLRHEASAAFTQVVRGSLLLGRDPDDPDGETGDQRVLAVSSSNLARIPPALVYRIKGEVVTGDEGESIETAKVVYIGESSADSHDLLRGHDPEESAERAEGREYLLGELAGGPRPARDLIKGAPCGERTLRKIKAELGIKARKEDFGSGWEWVLPEGCTTKAARPTPEERAALAETASESGKRDPDDAKAARPSGVAALGVETAWDYRPRRPVDLPPAANVEAKAEELGLSPYDDEDSRA